MRSSFKKKLEEGKGPSFSKLKTFDGGPRLVRQKEVPMPIDLHTLIVGIAGLVS
jgi:hypothetical protein